MAAAAASGDVDMVNLIRRCRIHLVKLITVAESIDQIILNDSDARPFQFDDTFIEKKGQNKNRSVLAQLLREVANGSVSAESYRSSVYGFSLGLLRLCSEWYSRAMKDGLLKAPMEVVDSKFGDNLLVKAIIDTGASKAVLTLSFRTSTQKPLSVLYTSFYYADASMDMFSQPQALQNFKPEIQTWKKRGSAFGKIEIKSESEARELSAMVVEIQKGNSWIRTLSTVSADLPSQRPALGPPKTSSSNTNLPVPQSKPPSVNGAPTATDSDADGRTTSKPKRRRVSDPDSVNVVQESTPTGQLVPITSEPELQLPASQRPKLSEDAGKPVSSQQILSPAASSSSSSQPVSAAAAAAPAAKLATPARSSASGIDGVVELTSPEIREKLLNKVAIYGIAALRDTGIPNRIYIYSDCVYMESPTFVTIAAVFQTAADPKAPLAYTELKLPFVVLPVGPDVIGKISPDSVIIDPSSNGVFVVANAANPGQLATGLGKLWNAEIGAPVQHAFSIDGAEYTLAMFVLGTVAYEPIDTSKDDVRVKLSERINVLKRDRDLAKIRLNLPGAENDPNQKFISMKDRAFVSEENEFRWIVLRGDTTDVKSAFPQKVD